MTCISRTAAAVLATASVALLGACATDTKTPAAPQAKTQPAEKKSGILADIAPTTADSTAKGNLKFQQKDGSVLISGSISGLKPNAWHAFHVHENGSCADAGNAAGGHINPTAKPHGMHGAGDHHVGDLPALRTDSKGVALVDITSDSVALSGPNSVIGKAVIVHADDDDYTAQPTGNAGARIGCGIITDYK